MGKRLKTALTFLVGAAVGTAYGVNKEKVDSAVKSGYNKTKGMFGNKKSCNASDVAEAIEETLD